MPRNFCADINGTKQRPIKDQFPQISLKTESGCWKFFVASILVFVLFCTFAGCGKSVPPKPVGISPELVGRWAIEEGQPTRGVPEELELLKDGTGIIDNMGVAWKTENGRFYFNTSLGARAYDYKIVEDTLTLTNNNGQNVTYKRGARAKVNVAVTEIRAVIENHSPATRLKSFETVQKYKHPDNPFYRDPAVREEVGKLEKLLDKN